MTDQATAPTTEAPKTSKPKAKKAKRTATKAKPSSNGELNYVLNERGLKVLAAVKSFGGTATLEKVEKRTKLPPRAVYHHLWCQRKLGFVRSQRQDIEEGISELLWECTAKGKSACK